ncbi:MAG TPA: exodeoxyribonuclease III [Anaerolineales bacterium]|nr:exodeoxyribonuclease III [Anaerolineales bacterium]
MQITTWNVNGLRALINKGAIEWVALEKPDVVCLQEIKARPDQLSEGQHAAMTAHQWTWNPAERPGYSGVATGLRGAAESASTTNGFGIDEFDREGRVIQSDHGDFLLFNIYFPNGSRDHARVPFKLDFYARLLDLCDRLHDQGRQVILTGDFNTSHREIDLANPGPNRKTTGFLPEERAWIDQYLEHGFVDAWRARYPDRVQYTWWTAISNARARNVGWRLDYFLVSEGLMERVADVVIHDEVMGSDHCPVSLFLKKLSANAGLHPAFALNFSE